MWAVISTHTSFWLSSHLKLQLTSKSSDSGGLGMRVRRRGTWCLEKTVLLISTHQFCTPALHPPSTPPLMPPEDWLKALEPWAATDVPWPSHIVYPYLKVSQQWLQKGSISHPYPNMTQKLHPCTLYLQLFFLQPLHDSLKLCFTDRYTWSHPAWPQSAVCIKHVGLSSYSKGVVSQDLHTK